MEGDLYLPRGGEGDPDDTSAIPFDEAFLDLVNRFEAQGLHNPIS